MVVPRRAYQRLPDLDEVVSRSLECEPRRWEILEHMREKMTCRDCEGVTDTPAPSHPILRGFTVQNLLASVLMAKLMLHQPLNRQSDTFAGEGVAVDTSTLADRIGACAVALAPIVEAIRHHVLVADRTHGDDTTVMVLPKGKTDDTDMQVNNPKIGRIPIAGVVVNSDGPSAVPAFAIAARALLA